MRCFDVSPNRTECVHLDQSDIELELGRETMKMGGSLLISITNTPIRKLRIQLLYRSKVDCVETTRLLLGRFQACQLRLVGSLTTLFCAHCLQKMNRDIYIPNSLHVGQCRPNLITPHASTTKHKEACLFVIFHYMSSHQLDCTLENGSFVSECNQSKVGLKLTLDIRVGEDIASLLEHPLECLHMLRNELVWVHSTQSHQ